MVKMRTVMPGLMATFTKVILVCILTSLITIILLFAKYDRLNGKLDTILKEESSEKSFFVQRYKLVNDYLELMGHYDQSENVSNSGENDMKMLRLEGIENLLNQIKPALLQDEKLERAILPFENFFKKQRKSKEVNCQKLFKGDKDEAEKTKTLVVKVPKSRQNITAEEYIRRTPNCSTFTRERGYIMNSLTKEENRFPIAYSILMFKDVWQFERLLRAIYRPQNYYCIHVDGKASDTLFKAVTGITNCFRNVFLASTRIEVTWGKLSVLEPELTCMRDLWAKSKTWKYFINLTGQEFPLRTNYELVKILKAYNGANDIDGTVERANKYRWKTAGRPPHGITPIKGSVHIVASRGFVGYILYDSRANDVLNWTRKTKVPDETYFAILNHNPGLNVPGSYRGLPETDPKVKPFYARFKNWDWSLLPCAGKRVRQICIFGVGDLPMLAVRKELFANKFHQDFERFSLDCMDELLYNRTRDQYVGKLGFDSRWYSKLGFVVNKLDV